VLREPLELGHVEDRPGGGDVLDVEQLDELGREKTSWSPYDHPSRAR